MPAATSIIAAAQLATTIMEIVAAYNRGQMSEAEVDAEFARLGLDIARTVALWEAATQATRRNHPPTD